MAQQREKAFQDGADFYAEKGGRIASYPALVENDFDMHGSAKARAKFAEEHGDKYALAEDAA